MGAGWKEQRNGMYRVRWKNWFGVFPVSVVLVGSVVKADFFGPFAKRRTVRKFNSLVMEA